MTDFRDALRKAIERGQDKLEQAREAERTERQSEIKRDNLVNEVAREIEIFIESCLKDFLEEFVEFRFRTFTDNGKNIQVHWTEPGQGRETFVHQLTFRVRRYHEYADVEVQVKMIVKDSEKASRRREEDVFDGDPAQLKVFVKEQIVHFAQIYISERGW